MKRSRLTEDNPSPALPTPAHASSETRTGSQGLGVGLQILEYLASRREPAGRLDIAAALNISPSSVYRSMIVLQERGYITRSADRKSFATTGKLKTLQPTNVKYQQLLALAQPVMRAVCDRVSQSCNLSVPSMPDMRVVAQEDSPGPTAIQVPVGFRYDIPASAPGIAFAAFAQSRSPFRWPQAMSAVTNTDQWTQLKDEIQRAVDLGVAQIANQYLPDITDLSCPILDNGHFVAALTIPFIKTGNSPSLSWCSAELQQAAEHLNQSLRSGALVA